jgi:acylpyruvate hydrolase
MKVASARHGSREFAGLVEGEEIRPLGDAGPLSAATDFAALAALAPGEPLPLAEVELLPVVPAPAKVFCLGLNFKLHVEETGRDLPGYPVLFPKFADSLVGGRDPIVKPPESDRLDFEAELVVVIGRRGRRIAREEALGHVAGYAVGNDVTARDFQGRSPQWVQGKAWERSSPVGPWMATADELGDASGLEISLSLNGEEMQRSNTELMIFDVATAVATISEFTPLGPGDLIFMGTPDGVGFRREPPVYLQPGDVLRVEVEGIGAIENEVIAEEIPA